jgi:hypothetical protein
MPDPAADRDHGLTVYEFTLQLTNLLDLPIAPRDAINEAISDYADLWRRDGRCYISFARGSTSRASAIAGAIRELAAVGIEAEGVSVV